MTFLAAIQNPM